MSGSSWSRATLAARINFATKDSEGKISDRRAGRIPTEEASELVDEINEKLQLDGAEVQLLHEKEHRAVAIFRGGDFSDALNDSDPQRTGMQPLPVEAQDKNSEAKKSAEIANEFVEKANEILEGKEPANTVLLRGFGMHPNLPSFDEILRA